MLYRQCSWINLDCHYYFLSLWLSYGLIELNISVPFLCLFSYFSHNCPRVFRGDLLSLVLFPSSLHPLLPVSMVSPLKPEEFAAKLSKHPDQFASCLCLGQAGMAFAWDFSNPTNWSQLTQTRPLPINILRSLSTTWLTRHPLGGLQGLFPSNHSQIWTLAALGLSQAQSGYVIPQRSKCLWWNWPRQAYPTINHSWSDYSCDLVLWLRHLDCWIWCWGSILKHRCPPVRSIWNGVSTIMEI